MEAAIEELVPDGVADLASIPSALTTATEAQASLASRASTLSNAVTSTAASIVAACEPHVSSASDLGPSLHHTVRSLRAKQATLADATSRLGPANAELERLSGAVVYLQAELESRKGAATGGSEGLEILLGVERVLDGLEIPRGTLGHLEDVHGARMGRVAGEVGMEIAGRLGSALEEVGFVAFDAIPGAELRAERGQSPQGALFGPVDDALEDALVLEGRLWRVPAARRALEIPEEGGNRGILAVMWLALPLKVRFHFHFLAEGSATNRPDKPEWMYAHVLKWLRKHALVASHRLGPLLAAQHNDDGEEEADPLAMFASVILSWVRAKVEAELGLGGAWSEGFLLAHAIAETQTFESAVAELLGVSAPTILPLFYGSERRTLEWLRLEADVAHAEMDRILVSSQQTHSGSAVASLVSVLLTRVSDLGPISATGPPLHLQLGLVVIAKHALSRYLRMLSSELSEISFSFTLTPTQLDRVASLLTSLHAVRSSLSAHDDTLLAISLLDAALSSFSSSPPLSPMPASAGRGEGENELPRTLEHASGKFAGLATLFEDIVSDYDQRVEGYVEGLAGNIENAFHVYTSSYRQKDTWEAIQDGLDEETELVPSADLAGGLSVLRDKLAQLRSQMAEPLFVQVFESVSLKMVRYLFRSIVRKRTYTYLGGRASAVDMETVALVLRREFLDSPRLQAIFAPLLQTVRLLALPLPELVDLYDQLGVIAALDFAPKTLAFLQVHHLDAIASGSLPVILDLLHLRRDLQ